MQRPFIITEAYRIKSEDETVALALQVVSWIVSDEMRAERMLGLTGLDPAGLRASLAQSATLRALLDFVLGHEPDLLACADALGVAPAAIAAARRDLGR